MTARGGGAAAFAPSQSELEPAVKAALDRCDLLRNEPAYLPVSDTEIRRRLEGFFAEQAPGAEVGQVRRMGGGASKEQFVFDLTRNGQAVKYVLRMDPRRAAVETDRRREFEALRAMQGLVPVPRPVWIDGTGQYFVQPAMIMEFIGGVTKPSQLEGASNVSGMAPVLDQRLRKLLAPQFIRNLVTMHEMDWKAADLPTFQAPDADPKQAARWQANWWMRVWRSDRVSSLPLGSVIEQWLAENAPAVDQLSLVHGDYRTGNYLFDEDTGNITALLDWELAHIGDFHEDLAWVAQRPFGSSEGQRFLVSGLFERQEFLDLYEAASGRRIDLKALRFYEVIAALKGICVCLATTVNVANAGHNHQNVLLTWMAAAGHIFHAELCELLSRDVGA